MKKLALVLGFSLASCAPIVTVQVAAPGISNVQNQRTYCTSRPTNLDFGLNYTGNVSRIEVYATPQGSGAPTQRNPGQFVGGSQDVFTIGRGRIVGTIVFQPQAAQGGTNVRVVPSNQVAPLSITVNPVNTYDLYFRAFSATGAASPFVAGQSVVPDDTVNCDPALRY